VTTKDEEEDPRNINIPEAEGHCKFEGPQIENLDITIPLKTRHVNISTEAELNFVKIEDYLDDATVARSLSCFVNIKICFPQNFWT